MKTKKEKRGIKHIKAKTEVEKKENIEKHIKNNKQKCQKMCQINKQNSCAMSTRVISAIKGEGGHELFIFSPDFVVFQPCTC